VFVRVGSFPDKEKFRGFRGARQRNSERDELCRMRDWLNSPYFAERDQMARLSEIVERSTALCVSAWWSWVTGQMRAQALLPYMVGLRCY
jgi:hypothetical protein